MKIYTVTYLINNYGSVLQAYALQSRLKENGVSPAVVRRKVSAKGSFIITLKSILKPQKHYSLFQRIKKEQQKKLFAEKNAKIAEFVKKNLSVIEIGDLEHFKNGVAPEDIFLAGSDQIWSVLNSNAMSKWHTLQWVDSKNKYSYAASIGLDALTEEQVQMYREGLADFRVVSLRESQAVDLIQPLFPEKVRQDLDPTLLYDSSFWREKESKRQEDTPYVFVYMLRWDMNVIELAKQVAKERGCKVIYTGLYADKIKGVTTVCNAGIEDFLSYIDYAEAVITNSFHGTVYSVLFEKPFLSVKLETTSSRVESFLNMTGLESRLVSAPFTSCRIPEVDFKRAKEIIEVERKKSLDYLTSICNG